jgi:hypothetical protein
MACLCLLGWDAINMQLHLCIGDDQGPPPLRRGEYLAENYHPGSLRLRHWAPPLESEGPRNSPTSSHASTPRACDLLQDTSRQDSSRRDAPTHTRTQSPESTSWRRRSSTRPSTARKLDQAPHGTSEAQSNSSHVFAPMIEPVSEDCQTFICSSTTLPRRIEHATVWCTKSTRR